MLTATRKFCQIHLPPPKKKPLEMLRSEGGESVRRRQSRVCLRVLRGKGGGGLGGPHAGPAEDQCQRGLLDHGARVTNVKVF